MPGDERVGDSMVKRLVQSVFGHFLAFTAYNCCDMHLEMRHRNGVSSRKACGYVFLEMSKTDTCVRNFYKLKNNPRWIGVGC